jgi:hypothetical protein
MGDVANRNSARPVAQKLAPRKQGDAQEVKKALAAAAGNLTKAARLLKWSRRSLFKYLNQHPDLRGFLDEDLFQTLLDLPQSNILDAILARDIKASLWYLEQFDPDWRQR